MLRPDCPGIPDIFTGVATQDPIAITLGNIQSHLVGWMTLENLARSMRILTPQAKALLLTFLTEHHDFAHTKEDGVEKWSNFHGKNS